MVTPVQRLKVDLFSLKMTMFGSFATAVGITISFFIIELAWWYIAIAILMFFSGVMQITQYIEKYQMLKAFEDVENIKE